MVTNEQYMAIQKQLLEIAKQVRPLDLHGFIAKIDLSESMGPILDPTLYRRAESNLNALKSLAHSLIVVQERAEALTLVILDTMAAEAGRSQKEVSL